LSEKEAIFSMKLFLNERIKGIHLDKCDAISSILMNNGEQWHNAGNIHKLALIRHSRNMFSPKIYSDLINLRDLSISLNKQLTDIKL